MGNHYIPKYYLKGFGTSDNPDMIWAIQKENTKALFTKINNIAQENRFYPPELEAYLANEIENPTIRVFEKIKNREVLTIEDKITLSKYMMVMIKRVPSHREWTKSKAPEIINPVFDNVEKQLDELKKLHPEKSETINRRKDELFSLRENKGDRLYLDIWFGNIPADENLKSVEILGQMTWRFFIAENDDYFITSDNPMFFFKWIGIGHKESEVTFPITKEISLQTTWEEDVSEGYYFARSQILKEINRRTASNFTKFIFSPKDDDWIHTLAKKENFRLNRII